MLEKPTEFATARLRTIDWRTLFEQGRPSARLTATVAPMLTEGVTASLPLEWRRPYTQDRAAEWISERESEATTFLVLEKPETPIGLLLLYESRSSFDEVELRIGYLIAERYWGRGFASELIEGLVGWCDQHIEIAALIAGVERDNIASRRVLEKAGFRESDSDSEETALIYRCDLSR